MERPRSAIVSVMMAKMLFLGRKDAVCKPLSRSFFTSFEILCSSTTLSLGVIIPEKRPFAFYSTFFCFKMKAKQKPPLVILVAFVFLQPFLLKSFDMLHCFSGEFFWH